MTRRPGDILSLSFTLSLTSNCTTPPATALRTPADSAIIVIPGYYGTRLSLATDHELVWGSAWEALVGHRSLVLSDP